MPAAKRTAAQALASAVDMTVFVRAWINTYVVERDADGLSHMALKQLLGKLADTTIKSTDPIISLALYKKYEKLGGGVISKSTAKDGRTMYAARVNSGSDIEFVGLGLRKSNGKDHPTGLKEMADACPAALQLW
eukprot:TRINITY_DN3904_c0_g1_i4.p2 TRINITY_DN3904_c0_g1~~TRINITY_DN3904_c0_g1_i4.p2  ORF type:complete len:134 (-),score=34.63 TRINITY_DN3904_c0_g1_i4:134-535(-)